MTSDPALPGNGTIAFPAVLRFARRLNRVMAGALKERRSRERECGLAEAQSQNGSESAGADFSQTVLERARTGDAEAFQAIFERYCRPLLAFI